MICAGVGLYNCLNQDGRMNFILLADMNHSCVARLVRTVRRRVEAAVLDFSREIIFTRKKEMFDGK